METVSSASQIKSGALLNDEIKGLIDKGWLVEDADIRQIKPVGYDARVDDAYYQYGKVHHITSDDMWIEIPPNDMVLVSSLETFKLPNNVVGHDYLRRGLTWKGLLLLSEGQIDPGYHGKIFGFLYNVSQEPVKIERHSHVFTVEFHYTTPTTPDSRPYGSSEDDRHQGAKSLDRIVPKGVTINSGPRAIEQKMSDIDNRLQERLTQIEANLSAYRQENEKLTERFFLFLGVLLASFVGLEILVALTALLR